MLGKQGAIKAGLLSQVSDSSGGRLSVRWSPTGQISSVSDQTGRSVQFTAFGGEPGGNPGDLKSISSPRLPGIPSLVGDLSFTYSSGSADPRLNHNPAVTHNVGAAESAELLQSFFAAQR